MIILSKYYNNKFILIFYFDDISPYYHGHCKYILH